MKSVFDFVSNLNNAEAIIELAKYYWDFPLTANLDDQLNEVVCDSFESGESEDGCINYCDIAYNFVYENYTEIVNDLPFLNMYDRDTIYELFNILAGNYPDAETENIFGNKGKSLFWELIETYAEDYQN